MAILGIIVGLAVCGSIGLLIYLISSKVAKAIGCGLFFIIVFIPVAIIILFKLTKLIIGPPDWLQ